MAGGVIAMGCPIVKHGCCKKLNTFVRRARIEGEGFGHEVVGPLFIW